MKAQLIRSVVAAGMIVAGAAAAGCAGKGETRYLDLKVAQPRGQMAEAGSAKIVVTPFEDRRSEKGKIGLRTHLWGGETYFNVTGERPGDIVAQTLVERLKSRGWQDRAWNARLAPAGTTADADVAVNGQVLEFSANAKSRVFSTLINTTSRLVFQSKNLGDGSTTTRTVEGVRSRTVFWFDEEDVQELLTETLTDGIERFLSDTAVEQKAVRPLR